MKEEKLTVALAGNPNSGKTTLFNSLTGSTAHVGNWPGVTVVSSMNGGVILIVKDGRLALDRSIASKILVA